MTTFPPEDTKATRIFRPFGNPGVQQIFKRDRQTMTTKTKKRIASCEQSAGAGPTAPASETAATLPFQGLTDRDVLYVLGEASWLMSRSPRHRFTFMADVEWAVLPPVVLKQARVFRNKPPEGQEGQPGTPLAFVTWAFVSDAVEARLKEGIAKLQPPEWRSGPHPWIIDVVAPFGGADKVLEALEKDVFGGRQVPVVGMTADIQS